MRAPPPYSLLEAIYLPTPMYWGRPTYIVCWLSTEMYWEACSWASRALLVHCSKGVASE